MINEIDIQELKQSLTENGEYYFSTGGRKYLLYFWNQCDGVLLNLCMPECSDCEILWQTAGKTQTECLDKTDELFILLR